MEHNRLSDQFKVLELGGVYRVTPQGSGWSSGAKRKVKSEKDEEEEDLEARAHKARRLEP